MTLSHVEDERLAELAEGSLPAPEADQIREHLGGCRSCLAAYVDAVRYRAAWLADEEAFHAGGGETRLAIGRPGHEGTPVPPAPRVHPRVVVPTALGVLIVAAAMFGFRSVREAPMASLRLPSAIESALARAPGQGLLLPGVTTKAAAEMRSGSGSNSAGVEAAVKEAVADYEAHRDHAESGARVVAALLASGEVETANEYATEALAAHPASVPLLVLAAEAKLRANDLTAAETLLRRATDRAPRDPLVALDLGVVQRQRNHLAEARVLFERAARSTSATIAERARRELESLARR